MTMTPPVIVTALAAAVLLRTPVPSFAQERGQNEANNPLTPKLTFNLQDYYTPSLWGLPGRDANQLLLRGLIPSNMFGVPQLLRFTMPIATAPKFPRGSNTGSSDLTLQDIFIFPGKPISFGAGPILVLPTAAPGALGAGKWQAGATGVAIAPQHWGILGALLTYQHSFAGDHNRPDTSVMTAQPLAFYNLPDGFYLRSSATWSFDFHNDTGFIPIGAGLGKVWEIGAGATMNTFVEPQYTVHHYGNAGTPRWQIFAGINFQFPVGKHD